MIIDLIFLCLFTLLSINLIRSKDYKAFVTVLVLGFLGRGIGAWINAPDLDFTHHLFSTANEWSAATSLVSISFTVLLVNVGLSAQERIVTSLHQTDVDPPLLVAIIPLSVLMFLLCLNVATFGDGTLGGPNQLALLISAGIAALLAQRLGVTGEALWAGVKRSVSDTLEALVILLLIGALAGTWMLSGVVPAMIDYGLMIMSPSYFLIATSALCALVSLASGSSWSTIATVGIALMSVGQALGFTPGLCAGAIISGAYFGDKMSPLSDTTNLAPAMAGGSLIPHIRAMLWTTTPAFVGSLLIFAVLGLGADQVVDAAKIESIHQGLRAQVWIHPILFIVPVSVAVLIVKRTPTLATLAFGTIFGGVVAVIAQPTLIEQLAGQGGIQGSFKAVMMAMSSKIQLPADDPVVKDLLSAKGMEGMLGTVWLIICALTFGGVMERSGFLASMSRALLKKVKSDRGLVGATTATSAFLNVTASDQYLAIVVPGRMYRQSYQERGLAPEALSRTLEDAGTVTSVLVPWNTCGAAQASVLGVATLAYAPFCFFNILSPLMTLLFAYMGWKQPRLEKETSTTSSTANSAQS
jgi:Na+:H+ antiporter, NhaC family